MRQFDLFANPVSAARREFPFVIVLQSDLLTTGRDRVVAPLTSRDRARGLDRRLLPPATFEAREFVILVPGLTAIPERDLKRPLGNLGEVRDRIVDALDYLFLGI